MKEYIVSIKSAPCWEDVQPQSIEQCLWSPNIAPAASVKACFVEGKALYVLVSSQAAPTRAENVGDNSSVWEDSCLECFLSFDGKSYMNLEANANSALRASFGAERRGRRFVKELGVVMPAAEASMTEEGWQVLFTVPVETVKQLWSVELKPGTEFHANFYSCGDKTPAPHFASWNPVETEQPDFHRPEFFGRLRIDG